jgi:hypothetical protein
MDAVLPLQPLQIVPQLTPAATSPFVPFSVATANLISSLQQVFSFSDLLFWQILF